MFRLFKRRQAIKSFVYRLSLELNEHFGQKTFYSVEEVDQLLEAGKFDKAFSAYAYAMFCSRATFDAYFSPLKVNCTYAGLRKIVTKRFFSGIIDFDASAVVHFAQGVGDSTYYESRKGLIR
jgi:hypothetical protein